MTLPVETHSTICRLAFGEDVHAQTTKEGERLLSAWENWFFASNLLSLLNIFLFNGAWKIFGGPLLKHWNAGKATIYGLIDRGLERRKRGEDLNRVSIMDDTLRSAKLPEFMKDDETFRKHLATLLFAGHDTTSGTCTIALHFLAHEPVWQARIRKELAELPEGPFSLEPLEGLPVLNAVIKETLRVYPAAPNGGGRYMLKDFTASYVDPVDKREKKVG